MTNGQTWPNFLLNPLLNCLAALSSGCPDAPDTAPTVRRLKSLSDGLIGGGLPSKSPGEPLAGSLPEPASLTLAQCLRLTAIAQGLLTAPATLNASTNAPTNASTNASTWPAAETAAMLIALLTDLAEKLGMALRREQARRIRGLYVIIDPEVTGGRDPLEIAQAALRGGARMLQLRDKLRDKGEILPLAQSLQGMCQANDALLIINDHVDLAAAVGSGGVHVGQTDLPVAQARQVLNPEQVLGRSNREIELLIESQEMGADHVAFGAIYTTTTKPGGRGPQGPERLRQARAVAKVPLVAIGGITAENAAPVIEAGADALCVTAAVGLAPEPEAAAQRLVAAISQAGGKI